MREIEYNAIIKTFAALKKEKPKNANCQSGFLSFVFNEQNWWGIKGKVLKPIDYSYTSPKASRIVALMPCLKQAFPENGLTS